MRDKWQYDYCDSLKAKVENPCTRQVFEVWLENRLVPELKPNQVLMLNNATFHRGGRISEVMISHKEKVLMSGLSTIAFVINPLTLIRNNLRKKSNFLCH